MTISIQFENMLLIWISNTVLFLIIRTLYKPGMPNFIFWGVFMQWVSASIELYYASWAGISLKDLFKNYRSNYVDLNLLNDAVIINLLGVLSFSLGCWLNNNSINKKIKFYKNAIEKINFNKYFVFYILYYMFALLLSVNLFFLPGLTQLFSFFIYIKWSFLFILFYLALANWESRRNHALFIILLEFLMGLSSFFAGSILSLAFYCLFAGLTTLKRITNRTLFFSSIFIILLFNFAVIWTAIKPAYRAYLSGGKNNQNVEVTKKDAISQFAKLAVQVDNKQYNYGIVELIRRTGYFGFISKVLSFVPDRHAHENGVLLLNSFTFYLMPRILFPNKEVIRDSEHTSKYLGVYVSGSETNTSISLGYIADAYIDFGIPLMFISPFILGFLLSFSCLFLIKQTKSQFWQISIYGLYFQMANINGTNTIKVTGPIIITLVIGYYFLRYFAPSLRKIIGYT